jgi:rubrerythrin
LWPDLEIKGPPFFKTLLFCYEITMAEKADLRRRPQRTTIKDILRTATDLEKKTMAFYMHLARNFQAQEELRKFWFTMARHEAGHLGALALVEGVLESEPDLAQHAKVWFDPSTVVRLRSLLSAYNREVEKKVSAERAFEMAIDLEASELEDVVVELLQVVKEKMLREQAIKLLIHDLSDLSYMVEKFTQNEALLARADELVERRVDALTIFRQEKEQSLPS